MARIEDCFAAERPGDFTRCNEAIPQAQGVGFDRDDQRGVRPFVVADWGEVDRGDAALAARLDRGVAPLHRNLVAGEDRPVFRTFGDEVWSQESGLGEAAPFGKARHRRCLDNGADIDAAQHEIGRKLEVQGAVAGDDHTSPGRDAIGA